MSTIPVLWPELRVDVVTPVAVLRVQAASLERLTQGILLGRVVGGEADDQAYFHLDVVAPGLNTTLRIVTITHRKGFPYPASLQWLGQPQPTPLERTIRALTVEAQQNQQAVVSSDDELEELLEKVLRSPSIKSAIYSLLARSNDDEPSPSNTAYGEGSGDEEQPDSVVTEPETQ